jgi:hypothetical protein
MEQKLSGDCYAIHIKGYLDARWSAWFEGLTLTHTEDGDTILHGPVIDQAALHGILARIRDLGLPLLAVNRLEREDAGGQLP